MTRFAAASAAACPAPRRQIYLHAGEVFAAAGAATVTTILGSCVAVCLFDPDAAAGGVNHYLLPFIGAGEPSNRFGNVAIASLVEEVLAQGASARRVAAKVFGGARVLAAPVRGARHLGEENVAVALRALEHLRIPVAAMDVGGERGRRLAFEIDTGTASVRLL